MISWQLTTGEYPPEPGGVADHSRLVAEGLAAAGDQVAVIAPACEGGATADGNLRVHRLPDHFGVRGLSEMNRLLDSRPDDRILVQYVPHAYGMKAMNLLFCLSLWRKRRREITVVFHEVAYPFRARQPLRRNALAAVTRTMAALVTCAATHIFIADQAFIPMLDRWRSARARITWLPVPSNVPLIDDCAGAAAVRSRYATRGAIVAGHFGTYGEPVAGMLTAVLVPLLAAAPEIVFSLLGRGSVEYRSRLAAEHPGLAGRIHATGDLPAAELSRHLTACDLMIQPYPDGISARRGSVMAALEHGRPVITTSGRLTETLWTETSAVKMAPDGDAARLTELALSLARDATARARLGCAARQLYEDRFALRHTIAALRSA